jgi:hypothetical protein
MRSVREGLIGVLCCRTKELQSPNRYSERILQQIQEAAQLINGKDEISNTAITIMLSLVKSTNDLLNRGFGLQP